MAEKVALKKPKKHSDAPKRIAREPSLCFGELVFNSNNELAFKYDLINICDKSSASTDLLSYLAANYYIIFETKQFEKYLLTISKKENLQFLVNEVFYKICKVANPLEFDNAFCAEHVKLDEGQEVVADNLLWSDIIWDGNSLQAKNKKIEDLLSFKFYQINQQHQHEEENN